MEVVTFGRAFYAGWGLTTGGSAQPVRPRGRASREALFLACYTRYCRYLDAWRRTPVSFEDAAEQLAWLKARFHDNGPTVCLGITPWKRAVAAKFLSGVGGPLIHASKPEDALALARSHKARLVVWASKAQAGLGDQAAQAGVALLRLEDGFLRSVGLGAKLVPPASLVLDPEGIYYDPTRASGFERLALETEFTPALLARARALREAVVALRLSKYNDGTRRSLDLPAKPYRVLVPGQVEDDASILTGTSAVSSNLALLEAVRRRHPAAVVIYKPHPDVAAGLRPGAIPADRLGALSDGDAAGWNMADLLDEVDRVETMTSLTGFEALLRGKPVTVHGGPFYAGWGLTEDLMALPRRTRTLSLDELTAVTLILYPRYIDPVSGRPCPPELVIERFAAIRALGPAAPTPLRNAYARVIHGMVIPLARKFGLGGLGQ